MAEITPITTEQCRTWLMPRPHDCHKGDFGNVGILGGHTGMAGAALLAGRAALWIGAGRVYAGLLDTRIAVDPEYPEMMVCAPERILTLDRPGCLVVGPGLGTSPGEKAWLRDALGAAMPLIVDADGLNLLALDESLHVRLRERTSPTLITPHPGEAARLLGCSTADIQSDRLRAVQKLAGSLQCTAVLKGAGTLVHSPGGQVWQNSTGNAGMAAPGMGDVLAGIMAALVAQGLPVEQAAIAGVHLHGSAGDLAVSLGQGPVGLTASEVGKTARRVLNQWIYASG